MGHMNVPFNGPPGMWSMGPGIGISQHMDLGSPWAGWQFALTHNRLSSGKMLSINGYLKWVRRHHPHEKVGIRFSAQYWVRKPGENMRRRGGIIHMKVNILFSAQYWVRKTRQEFAAARKHHPHEKVGIRFSAQYWVRKPGKSSQWRGGIIHMSKGVGQQRHPPEKVGIRTRGGSG
jgi:hypothetical protein